MVEKLIEALGFRLIGVVQEEYAVSTEQMRMFGVMDLNSEFDGCRFAIGLRNSHDKSFQAVNVTVGLRVLVFETLAFHGDVLQCLPDGVQREMRSTPWRNRRRETHACGTGRDDTLKRGGRDSGPKRVSRSRTHKVSSAAHTSGSATLSVVFSPGKIDDVKFVSGDEKLKTMASEIASSKVRADFPNADAVRLTRRGILVCGRWVAISPCCCRIAFAPRNRKLMGGLSFI